MHLDFLCKDANSFGVYSILYYTLVWYLDVEISEQGGSGSLSIRDHQGASPLTRAWGAGATEKGSFGTIPSNSGEHSITVTLRGQDSFVHLKVAGALVRSWTL